MARPAPLFHDLAWGLALALALGGGCKQKQSTLDALEDEQGGAGLGDAEAGQPCAVRQDCAGGLACTDEKCSPCTADGECSPVACTPESGRCRPEGQCEADEQCASGEKCDGGMCVFAGLGEGGGPCGLAAVFFARDSDELTPRAQDELARAATCIAGQKGRTVYLEAHADDPGTDEYAMLVTERRALAVREFLVGRGVPAEMVQVIAKGSLEAAATDEPTRARERRVQLTWPE